MKKEPRKLFFGSTPVILLLVVITLLYTGFFAANSVQFDQWMQSLSNWKVSVSTIKIDEEVQDQESIKPLLTRLVTGESKNKFEATGFACDSALTWKLCVANGPLKIDTSTLKVHIPSNSSHTTIKTAEVVRPYAKQDSEEILKNITAVHMILHDNISKLPACQQIHHIPAVIFSSSGYTGNLYHEFNEIIIPLFITSRHFQSNVRFIITDYNPYFVRKYSPVFSRLSRYEIMDPSANRSIYCFPGAVVGLKFHNVLGINSSDVPGGYSMEDFKRFLRQSFNIKAKNVISRDTKTRPVLLFISRLKSRKFLNEREMVKMMEELGFEVVVPKPQKMSKLAEFSKLVSSCSVLVGAHGAGLTNELFLPEGAVMVQVVPIGLNWFSDLYYGNPAEEMGVHSLKYKITPEESSLIDMYGPDDPVMVDPRSFYDKGYEVGRAMYIGQNMKIDVGKFRKTLVEALMLLGRSTNT